MTKDIKNWFLLNLNDMVRIRKGLSSYNMKYCSFPFLINAYTTMYNIIILATLFKLEALVFKWKSESLLQFVVISNNVIQNEI